MCGIAGTIGVREDLAVPAAEAMRAALRHRGPDGDGLEVIRMPGATFPTVLAHTRLAILDTSAAGRQPMAVAVREVGGAERRVWLSYNGEIYNFRELRDELAALGLHAATGTDTEIILLAYQAWGEAAVERLRGMFAFALADADRNRILLARDRLGIKPLYLFRPRAGGLLFASEVRALLAAGDDLLPRRLSLTAVESYLAQGAIYGLDAFVEGIELLPPGEFLSVDGSGARVAARRYWSIPFLTTAPPPTREAAVARLAQTLRDAVGRHLISDVPIGVFLSGGIDSAAVATLAVEASQGPVRTIGVGFDQPDFDESDAAAETAHALGTEHRTVVVRAADVLADFDRVLAAVDQPTVDGFNTYFVSRAAREAGVKAALSGLGGDELFGGYASFRDLPRAWNRLRHIPRQALSAQATRGLARLVRSRALLKIGEALERPHDPTQLYLLRRELLLPAERRRLAPLPPGCDRWSGVTAATLDDLRTASADLDPENAVSALEISGYMRNMLLRDADVFSMAHGLEIRVPLLDHEVVEATAPLPGAWKRPQQGSKRLLIDAVGHRLPPRVASRPKRGFTFPWSQWLKGDLSTFAAERLNDEASWRAIGWDAAAPAGLWRRFLRGDPAVGGLQILALLVLADVIRRQRLSL